jgi:hypothetical protein
MCLGFTLAAHGARMMPLLLLFEHKGTFKNFYADGDLVLVRHITCA